MMYRQGDVLLIPCDAPKHPARCVPRDNGRVVLAYGEVTGHAHAILDAAVELFEERDGRFYLRADVLASVVHEEHDTITIPPGWYEVRHQREYTPERIVRVAD